MLSSNRSRRLGATVVSVCVIGLALAPPALAQLPGLGGISIPEVSVPQASLPPVELPEGTQISLPDGSESSLPAGTQISLPDGTTLPLGSVVELPPGTQISLPDGTQIALPSGTQISLPASESADGADGSNGANGKSPATASKPVVSVRVPRQRIGTVRARGLKVSARSSRPGTVVVRVLLPGAHARKLRLGTRKAVVLGQVSARISKSSGKALRVKLPRGVRKALARSRSLKLTVSARLTDDAGSVSRNRTRKATLKR